MNGVAPSFALAPGGPGASDATLSQNLATVGATFGK